VSEHIGLAGPKPPEVLPPLEESQVMVGRGWCVQKISEDPIIFPEAYGTDVSGPAFLQSEVVAARTLMQLHGSTFGK
jgi:hypothetical protein